MQVILKHIPGGHIDHELIDYFNTHGLERKYRNGILIYKKEPIRGRISVRPNTWFWRVSWFIRSFICAFIFWLVSPLCRKLQEWEIIKEAENGFLITFALLRERSSRLFFYPKTRTWYHYPEIGMLLPYKASKLLKLHPKEYDLQQVIKQLNTELEALKAINNEKGIK